MTCKIGPGVIICGSFGYPARRTYRDCSACKRRTRHVVQWDGAWYGTTAWCYSCGLREQDGYLTRGTDESRSHAAKVWHDGAVSPREYEAFVRQDIARACG